MDHMHLDLAKEDRLILVDGLDRQTGAATKETVHRCGLLHRAFSAVLFRETGKETEILLSRRADGKYHSGGLWANSCCSHPRDGESLDAAVPRRIHEELGCASQDLEEIGSFLYRAVFADGICEYEYDHVFIGRIGGDPHPDPDEVSQIMWVSPRKLSELLSDSPEIFSAWAYTVLAMVLKKLTEK